MQYFISYMVVGFSLLGLECVNSKEIDDTKNPGTSTQLPIKSTALSLT